MKLHEWYANYIQDGLVVAPIYEGRRVVNRYRELSSNDPFQIERWVSHGETLGLATGRYARQVAVEVKSLRGQLILAGWSRGRVDKTWTYLADGSLFYIYRLPDELVTREKATFYSEQDHDERQPTAFAQIDLRLADFDQYKRAAYPRADANLIIWGDNHVVPLPAVPQGVRFTEVNSPTNLRHVGGLARSPNWLNLAIEANTYPATEDERAPLSSDIVLFLANNTLPSRRARLRSRLLYECYLQDATEQGIEPRSERDMYLTCQASGYKMKREKLRGVTTTFITGLEPLPFSRLDRFLRA